MRVKKKLTWLLLLLRLPATHKAERVAIWRKLKKSGAIQIQTSTYILPDEPARYEAFQWLTQEVRSAGGDATLVRAREIEGLPNEKLIELFNTARAKEYATLRELLRALSHRRGKRSSSTSTDKLDRVGSAWLIRKFIDPKAKFIFAKKIPTNGRAVSFDMLDGEFSHHGEDCTFETLVKRFRIQDKAAHKIGEMIHDADLDDEKFERTECIGIDRVLKGWGREGISDQEILRRGLQCFDGLYAFLRRV